MYVTKTCKLIISFAAAFNITVHLQYQSIKNSVLLKYGRISVGESVASSAVKTAIDVNAKLIVVLSAWGKMAGYVAKFRPRVSAIMLTPNITAARQASGLFLGMHSVQVDSFDKVEELIDELNYELIESKTMDPGDKIVVIGGRMAGSLNEQLQIMQLSATAQPNGRFVKGGMEKHGFFFNRGLLLSFGKN